MNKIPPDNITEPDIVLFLKSFKHEVVRFDEELIVYFKDPNNKKVGKMNYVIYKSSLQGKKYILKSYDLKGMEEELNKFRTDISPIAIINGYTLTLI
ncbi:MAG: hypothetical protein EB059_10950 [Alphaproteobacteria bacterium]|jgi:hypothetical protein|nr:hypothetical protein [Alphaproteobacteria bacterium]